MKTITTLALTSIALIAANSVSANSHWKHSGHHEAKARVISTRPIYETIQVARPEKRCWKESHVAPYRSHQNDHSYTSTIAGGIVGGALGNQFGKGNGNKAMTVAGALLGASIGNDINNDSYKAHHRPRHNRPKKRCETTTHYDSREELVAYDVTYKYHGRTYNTRMDYDPGDTLRVKVKVAPIF